MKKDNYGLIEERKKIKRRFYSLKVKSEKKLDRSNKDRDKGREIKTL